MALEFGLCQSITGQDIRRLRSKLGLNRMDFAALARVSHKTVENWENGKSDITGPIVFMYHILNENPQIKKQLEFPKQEYPLRLIYMYRDTPCTLIDVDEVSRLVSIKNFTADPLFRAFGNVEYPDFVQYSEFLESRCFPATRDKMKIELEKLGIPFYDPLLIIEKTEGRMADDLFRVKVIKKGAHND